MAPNPILEQLNRAGVSIWLDTLSRQLLDSGKFGTLIHDCSITGATSNPTIFAKAITGSSLYDDQLQKLAAAGTCDSRELFADQQTAVIARIAQLGDALATASKGAKWKLRARVPA